MTGELTIESKRTSRDRGTGCVYCRENCALSEASEGCGHVLYLKWSVDGRVYRESSRTISMPKAKRMLAQKIAESRTGTYLNRRVAAVTVADLFEGLLRDYSINGRKSLSDVEARWKLHLKPFFGYRKAADVKRETLKQYVDQRQKEGASNATINRELAALKRAFSLAMDDLVTRMPKFPHLTEDNIRTGFVEDADYEKLAAACSKEGIWCRALFETGYSIGWRVNELLGLKVGQVDLLGRTLRLEPGTTKNKEGREAPVRDKLYPWLLQCVSHKRPTDFVFTRDLIRPVRDFRTSWYRACCSVGLGKLRCRRCQVVVMLEGKSWKCPVCRRTLTIKGLTYEGLIFHDLRRTAVRNMTRLGIPERVAQQISGHKTRSIFDRYDIVSSRDVADARVKMNQGGEQTVHRTVHTETSEGTAAEVLLNSLPHGNA